MCMSYKNQIRNFMLIVTHPSVCRSPNKQSKKSNAAVVVVVVIWLL